MKKIIDLRKKIAPLRETEPKSKPAADPTDDFVIPYPKFSQPQVLPDQVKIPTSITWFGEVFYHNPDLKAVWIVAGFLFGLALLFQFFQKNLITTVFLTLLGLTLILHAKRKPRPGRVEIDSSGIKINEQLYAYKQLKSFWVDYQPNYEVRELSLQLKKWYIPYLKIQIGSQNPVHLRTFLIQFIPEVEHEETLADAIGRRLGM